MTAAKSNAPLAASVGAQHTPPIEWSVASRALPGEVVSGDLHLVAPWSEGVLIGVIDGLGHGDEATMAARIAVETLGRRPDEPLVVLVQHCHRALRQTRGVVMTLASIDRAAGTVATLGIGNVETLLYRANPRSRPARESVLLRGGVVGYQLPALQVDVRPIAPHDVMVFATDGVREDFGDSVRPADGPARIVQQVMGQKFRGTDDGLVLALKFTGSRP